MRVLALTKYGSLAASTRQRFLQYEPLLGANGITVDVAPLLGNDHLQRLAAGRGASVVAVARAYASRLARLLTAHRYDVLWVHCELFPYLPGFLERLSAVARKPIVFDYDDAIFHMYDASRSPVVRVLLGKKLVPLLRSASVCCCGNDYLERYAARFCEHTTVLPTVVDTDVYTPRDDPVRGGVPVIGWIGSAATAIYLEPLMPLLSKLTRSGRARVKIVGAVRNMLPASGMEFVDWSEPREVAEVQSMDIGIMPVPDDPWARGKSGYKLIQYMACGLPVIASPVGVNSTIVEEGINGFLASDVEQWASALDRLVADADLRKSMGEQGRRRAVEHYSLHVHAPRLVEAMQDAVARATAGQPS